VNVALIVEWLDTWRGGAETSTQQFIQHLLDLGVDVDVYTRSSTPSRPHLRVHTIGAGGPTRALKTLSFCRRCDEAVRRGRYDIVHAITPSLTADVYEPRGGTYAETIARNLALPQTGSARVAKRVSQYFKLKQRLLLNFERRLFGRAGGPVVVALSDYVVRQIGHHYNLPPERLRVVYNGVDPDTSSAQARARDRESIRGLYKITDDALLVLMVAHNFKLKGLRCWIEALALLRRERSLPVHALVVGKDSVLPWRKLVTAKGLDDCLQFAGPTQRVRSFYHAADVLVHPTFYDPCSRVVLEAMVSGLPCITTRFDGASEVIEDGVNGFVIVSPEQTRMIADRIAELGDASRREGMGRAASQIADRVSMRRHAEGMYHLYQELSNGSKAP
jgi:UDP-glucose:(heptosyl)LPS alpha-1,3-glucosyltransferase